MFVLNLSTACQRLWPWALACLASLGYDPNKKLLCNSSALMCFSVYLCYKNGDCGQHFFFLLVDREWIWILRERLWRWGEAICNVGCEHGCFSEYRCPLDYVPAIWYSWYCGKNLFSNWSIIYLHLLKILNAMQILISQTIVKWKIVCFHMCKWVV